MKAVVFKLFGLLTILPTIILTENILTTEPDTSNVHKVYRIFTNTTEQLEILKSLRNSATKYKLDFWKDPTVVGSFCDIMAASESQPNLELTLTENHIDYSIIISDVRQLIEDRENNDQIFNNRIMMDSTLKKRNREQPYFNFHQYQSYDEIRNFMKALESFYPNFVKVTTIGYSVEKKPIDMIQIGSPLYSSSKKAIWIDAGIHAREWLAPSTAVYFINELVTRYNQDPLITQYVQNVTWYITPVVNPDGYDYSRSSRDPEVRLWRKNRSQNNNCNDRRCCMGVDLNRNFDFHWGESGASANSCDEDYEGAYVFSEPESRVVRDFVMEHKNQLEAFITLHTYSQLWIHPYGHKKYNYPADIEELKSTANEAADALKSMYGTKFTVGSGADTLYVASGGSDDWSKQSAGIKYVYLLELRPNEYAWDGFILPSSQIIPTGRETWAGLKVVANAVLHKNGFNVVESGNRRNKRKRQKQIRLTRN